MLSDFPRSELACDHAFQPKKRPRVAAGRFSEDQSAGLRLQLGRVLGSGAASSSGTLDNGASVSQSQQGLLSRLYHQDVEIDALLRLEVRYAHGRDASSAPAS